MIKNQDFIVFSDDWGRHPSSCQHIFKRIAMFNRVLWVNTIGLKKPQANRRDLNRGLEKIKTWIFKRKYKHGNVLVYSPVMAPFYGNEAFKEINRRFLLNGVKRLLAENHMKHPILVTTVPNISNLVGHLGEKKSVYYCVDDFSKWPGMEKHAIAIMEKELIDKVDMILTSSDKLYRCKKRRSCQRHKLYHGVDAHHFRKCSRPNTKIPDIVAGIKRPMVGFFGLLDERFDLDILKYINSVRPYWQVVILGKVTADVRSLKKGGNFLFVGEVPYSVLPNYLKAFRALILPYLVDGFTENINPLKLKEYLATGKPIISTNLPEVRAYKDVVEIARSKHEFLKAIESSLKEKDKDREDKRRELVMNESWEHKAEEMSGYLEGILK